MSKPTFYHCTKCGNVIGMLKDAGVRIICCGDPMQVLTANTVDASREKHVPVIEHGADGTMTAKIGSVMHPMTPEHHIEWIAYMSAGETHRLQLVVDKDPQAVFPDKTEGEVYAFCNLHGLWKTEI